MIAKIKTFPWAWVVVVEDPKSLSNSKRKRKIRGGNISR